MSEDKSIPASVRAAMDRDDFDHASNIRYEGPGRNDHESSMMKASTSAPRHTSTLEATELAARHAQYDHIRKNGPDISHLGEQPSNHLSRIEIILHELTMSLEGSFSTLADQTSRILGEPPEQDSKHGAMQNGSGDMGLIYERIANLERLAADIKRYAHRLYEI
tara:strand:- start:51233 stop:51724 length:492 start_codon:yes stop_codon:yes gene_type:complete